MGDRLAPIRRQYSPFSDLYMSPFAPHSRNLRANRLSSTVYRNCDAWEMIIVECQIANHSSATSFRGAAR
jgi:hypothetical protein